MYQTRPPTLRDQLRDFLGNRRLHTHLLIAVLTIAGIMLWGIWLVGVPSFPKWVGFNDKTLYDALGIALIPLAIFFGGVVISWQQKRVELASAAAERQNDRQIARDREEEAALQAYFDRISDLLLNHHLREKSTVPDAEERSVARALTLATLRRLNGERKGMLVNFLNESGLISRQQADVVPKKTPLVRLYGANLERADLHETSLMHSDLSGANLAGANLAGATLVGANLYGANLAGANLAGVNFQHTIVAMVKFDGALIDERTSGLLPELVAKLMGNAPATP
jgi:uncharacterized protein YjbI with pentapeptide repeats